MDPNVSVQIVKLPALSRQQLLELWQKLYRKTAPTGIRKELMVPFLAYRIQENAYGGLKPATRSKLRRLASEFDKSKSSPEIKIQRKLKTGTRIFRDWRGETHEVIVTEEGYEYRGARYRSLSEIVRKITSVRWSGPAFFRLNRARPDRDVIND